MNKSFTIFLIMIIWLFLTRKIMGHRKRRGWPLIIRMVRFGFEWFESELDPKGISLFNTE